MDPNAQQPQQTARTSQPQSTGSGATNQITAPRRIRKAEKQKQAVEYRLMGATYSQIGEKLGCSKVMAFKYVKEALEMTGAATQETAELYRKIQLERIDQMLFGLMPAAKAGSVLDVDRVIKLQQEQRRLIPGIEVPIKVAAGVGGLDDNGEPSGVAPIRIVQTPLESMF